MGARALTDRPLPDWLIVGAPKAGTTTLAAWLGEHPEAFVSPVKEVSYFDLHHDRGPDWYAGHFAAAQPGQVRGEATPAYMYVDRALDRIAAASPDVRLAIILREPVDRLWSNYWYFRAMGIDARPFDRVLRAEQRDPGAVTKGMPVGHIGAGRYVERLEAITARFPREQLCVLFFDDLKVRPGDVYGELCRHLGIDDTIEPPGGEHNVGRTPRSAWLQWATLRLRPRSVMRRLRTWNLRPGSYPRIDPAVEAELRAVYEPHNAALERWLGRPLPAAWTHGAHA